MALARACLLWSTLAHAGLLVAFACLVGAQPARRRAAPPLVRFEAFASDATPATAPREAVACDVCREEAPLAAVVDWPEPESADAPQPADEGALAEPCARRERCRLAASAMQQRVVAPPPANEPPPPTAAAAATSPSAPSVRTIVPIAGTDQPPQYPPLARRRHWEGTVVLGIDCDAAGVVQLVRVLRSSGHQVLDDAAVAAVRQWRFAAGPGHCEQPVSFTLQTR